MLECEAAFIDYETLSISTSTTTSTTLLCDRLRGYIALPHCCCYTVSPLIHLTVILLQILTILRLSSSIFKLLRAVFWQPLILVIHAASAKVYEVMDRDAGVHNLDLSLYIELMRAIKYTPSSFEDTKGTLNHISQT